MTAALPEATVQLQRGGVELIDRLQEEWAALGGDEPFLRPEWIRAFVRAFAADDTLLVVSARVGGRLCAVLALLQRTRRFLGNTVTVLESAANVHSCRFDLARAGGEEGAVAARALWERLLREPGWTLLELDFVPARGELSRLAETPPVRRYLVAREDSVVSPYMPLPPRDDDWEEWLRRQVAGNFRRELRRRARRLADQGEVELQRVDQADAAALGEFHALEAAGWKGAGATAIDLDPATRAFYDEVAAAAAQGGYLALHFLRLNGHAIAAHFGLDYAGRYFIPKVTYDETYAGFAPGQQLVHAVARDGHARGLTEFDFLGAAQKWKLEWTAEARPLQSLYLHRRSVIGRLMYASRFGWKPLARRLMARSRQPRQPSSPSARG